MKHLPKLVAFLYIIVLLALRGSVSEGVVAAIVITVIINIYSLRIKDSTLSSLLSFFSAATAIWLDPRIAAFLCLACYDFAYKRQWALLVLVPASGIILADNNYYVEMFFACATYTMLGYFIGASHAREIDYNRNLDEERRLRYELEEAKEKLTKSSSEIVRLAGISERNRIAREIHDNVGHSISSILIRLRLARKLYNKDENESKEILDSSINSLSDTMTLLRETVHNIKPRESLGIDYIRQVIEQFSFCRVKFKVLGDAGVLEPSHLEFAAVTIKEALTNVAKHSNATIAEVSIDINPKIMRLEIKDNGKGALNIKEGMGISGMRERAVNMGGTVSVSSVDNFIIVCIIPLQKDRAIF